MYCYDCLLKAGKALVLVPGTKHY